MIFAPEPKNESSESFLRGFISLFNRIVLAVNGSVAKFFKLSYILEK
ncbi:transposase [Bacillus sp. IT-79MI2]|nr:hypothetical protein BTH41_04429 [Bacillus mycoides]